MAAAGGGKALYGINFFPNEDDVTLKPYAPILKKPTFVEMWVLPHGRPAEACAPTRYRRPSPWKKVP